MSTKKRFAIAPDLASGLRNSIESAEVNHGQLHYDMMPLNIVERDPNNPRKLAISYEEIIQGLNQADSLYPVKMKELESLKELASSIKRVGIRNAIEVYKEGQKYRIISGERRYLAAILSGQVAIPVRINQKPDEFKLRYLQWVENIHRQDLSLWEKYSNLTSIAEAYSKANQKEFNEKTLQELIGISNIQAYRYFSLLKADQKIIDLVKIGKLNNLKVIQELVSMKDKGAREQILSWISSAKDEVTTLANYKIVAGKKATKASSINLGRITNINTAKWLVNIVLSDKRLNKYQTNFRDIDWASSKEAGKALKKLFKAIEKELSLVEAI